MIKNIAAATYLWLALIALHTSYAQQPNNHTLGNLWTQVQENYSGIEAKKAEAAASGLKVQEIKSKMLPQFQIQAQGTYGTSEASAGAFFPQPGIFNISGGADPSMAGSSSAGSYTSATVAWDLYSFGKLRQENEAAKALYSQSLSENEAYLLALKKDLSERYILLLYSHATLNWIKKNADRLDEIRKTTVGLTAAGIRPAADSLLAASSFIQAMSEADKWTGFQKAALVKVAELYGSDAFDYGASSRRFTNPPANYREGSSTIDPAHPLLAALKSKSKYYKFSGEAKKKEALPSFHLMGGYSYRSSGINPDGMLSGRLADGLKNSTHNMLAGIGLTWNITDLRTSRLKGQRLEKKAAETDFLQRQYELKMQADLSASQAKIIESFKQLQKAALAVTQADKAYKMYLARYKSGLIALSEVLQIRLLLEQAEKSHIEAAQLYWLLIANHAELTADFNFLFNSL